MVFSYDFLRASRAVIVAFALLACGGDDSNPGTTDAGSGDGGGVVCGSIRCPEGKVCCNPLMDLCTAPGEACIQ